MDTKIAAVDTRTFGWVPTIAAAVVLLALLALGLFG
ncbi:hypothetical protein EV191_101205 [Tamaricihabitans halophyticus]|uniref:Uncharacterized protein n=1 Tax=Tamaricihabitans halophyticus TaxID=1262583 RepID=A0A4R2R356_9PSEU|nr:hypothetical protein EV191_101205 [Tamaricihabitans halophyticus]